MSADSHEPGRNAARAWRGVPAGVHGPLRLSGVLHRATCSRATTRCSSDALCRRERRQAASLRRLRRRQRRGELAGAGARHRRLRGDAWRQRWSWSRPPEVVAGGEQVEERSGARDAAAAAPGRARRSIAIPTSSAIGGGAVLDMVGFVAATTHRGVRHVRVPTTVLAQNDSGVGVKNGVNAFGVKNFLGTLRAAVRGAQRLRASCARCSRATASPAWPRRSRSR